MLSSGELLLPEKGGPDWNMDTNKLNSLICTTFLFTFLWSIAGNLVESSMDAFDTFARDLFSDTNDVKVRRHWFCLNEAL